MLRRFGTALTLSTCAVGVTAIILGGRAAALDADPSHLTADNASGQMRSFRTRGAFDLDNPFFQDLGTNGRRCVTCHQPGEGWAITPEGVRARFDFTDGADAIFRTNDGSNCEGVAAATRDERERAYSLLLERGLIRIGLDIPAGAEFAIDGVVDPYECPPATNDVSFYRRPLPAANISFLSAVMWDGRESQAGSVIRQDLRNQANTATRGHAASARDLTADEASAIVDFVTNLFAAQVRDNAPAAFRRKAAVAAHSRCRASHFSSASTIQSASIRPARHSMPMRSRSSTRGRSCRRRSVTLSPRRGGRWRADRRFSMPGHSPSAVSPA